MKPAALLVLLLAPSAAMTVPQDASFANVVWTSPSADHRGSMPLGNGDIGLNAWVEPSGELVFLVAKTDAWDDNGRLVKVGKVRVALHPAPPMAPFRQELNLADASLRVGYGDGTTLRVWVDANHPVVQVEIAGPRPSTATASIELWRTERLTLPSIEVSDALTGDPKKRPTIVEPDTVLRGQAKRIGWFHHNAKSVGPALHAEVQGMADYPRQDPLLHRTFGAVVTATGAERIDDTHLRSAPARDHRFAVTVLTRHPSTPDEWLRAMDSLLADIAETPLAQRRGAHEAWWTAFWNRSWIRASSKGPAPLYPSNDLPLRVGVDQRGGNRFSGEIRSAKVPESLEGAFALEAEVRAPAETTGRIFDKITPGGSDGFLLDVQPGDTLRLIAGSTQLTAKGALPPGRWAKVSLQGTARGWRVVVDGRTVIATDGDDAAHVSRMFALQRFVTACAGRGRYPIKFNGSLFTVPFEGGPGGPDYRRWGPGYWWQNTRLPYLAMCADGDTEMMEPLWRLYVDDFLPLNKARTKRYFGFDDAAYYIECVHFWGDVFNQSYGWTPMGDRKDPLQESGWHKWEWVAGPELVWMMLDAYEHTLDRALLEKRIVPTADAVMRFFDRYYKTDARGKLVMHPSQALETWWDCTNPMPEVAGLRAIAERLLALPASDTPPASRAYWNALLAKLPPLPTRDTPDGKALAPAERFEKKSNIENPELYAVFPFRLCSFEKANRELGLRALELRWDRGSSGWRQDDLFMAYLGLAVQARDNVVARARSHDPNSRFPAFWGPNYDWVPDQDHGGVLMRAFQAMLMQTEGRTIFLLPAWPKEWDCEFKLHAPYRTVVEGRVAGGRLAELKVTPPSRRADVIVVAAPPAQGACP